MADIDFLEERREKGGNHVLTDQKKEERNQYRGGKTAVAQRAPRCICGKWR